MNTRILQIGNEIRWLDTSEPKIVGYASPIPESGEVLEERKLNGDVLLYEFDVVVTGLAQHSFAATAIRRGQKDIGHPFKAVIPATNGMAVQLDLIDQIKPLPPAVDTRVGYVRATSIEAYRSIVAEGTIGRLQAVVYDVLFREGALTATEVLYFLPDKKYCTQHSIAPRFAEMKRWGVIEDVGKRKCRITGRICIICDVTGRMPVKPMPVVSLREEICIRDETISELKERLSHYEVIP
jgi:hypothetical protein